MYRMKTIIVAKQELEHKPLGQGHPWYREENAETKCSWMI